MHHLHMSAILKAAALRAVCRRKRLWGMEGSLQWDCLLKNGAAHLHTHLVLKHKDTLSNALSHIPPRERSRSQIAPLGSALIGGKIRWQ